MSRAEKYPKSNEELKSIITEGAPILICGSKTSTVIPYETSLNDVLVKENITIVNLSQMPPVMKINADGSVYVGGSVTWLDLREFCLQHGFQVQTSPTEELACVLSGLATSATGERCFGLGTLRDQVLDIEYMGADGQIHFLSSSKQICDHQAFDKVLGLLAAYQDSYKSYESFKNAPFIRLEKETDLLIGSEGQLGVILGATLKIIKDISTRFVFIHLPRWEEDFDPHLEIFYKVQKFKSSILICEFLDSHSLAFLPQKDCPVVGQDLLVLEIKSDDFEMIYEDLLLSLELIDENHIFEMKSSEFHQLRMNVPRSVFEANTRMGVKKMGTDVQVSVEHFVDILKIYKNFSRYGVGFNLFGHFGDAHLHFNFMPNPNQIETVQVLLNQLYEFVYEIQGSPFAEHGIGLLKKPFISKFYNETHRLMFFHLKSFLDPQNIFFPIGFFNSSMK